MAQDSSRSERYSNHCGLAGIEIAGDAIQGCVAKAKVVFVQNGLSLTPLAPWTLTSGAWRGQIAGGASIVEAENDWQGKTAIAR